ncbi:hypothetical protein NC651_030098 [Populus alba x Populus x berolinensis]|nr:hypothetical protein NC651_030098 [Populus alba x Populus x berolinensis]
MKKQSKHINNASPKFISNWTTTGKRRLVVVGIEAVIWFGSASSADRFIQQTSRGKHFGFITILSNLLDKTLLECLNDIWFDSYKLRVNMAKHRRKDEVTKQKTVGTGKQIPKLNNKAKAPIHVRDNRSYLEAVRSGSQVHQVSDNATPCPHNFISFNTTDEEILWLRNSLIRKISQGVDYAQIRHGLIQLGICFSAFYFLGGSQAIISFDGEKSMQQAMQKGTHLLEIHDSIALMLNSNDSDDEVYTDLAFDLAGDDNIYRLGIADKNCGADDKAHTLKARKHNPHGTYEVYDHSFAATINATDNTERLHIVVQDLFPEIAAPRTPHHYFSTNKLSQNQLQVERGLVLYDVNSASPLEHPSMAFKRDSFSPQPYTPVSSDDSLESHYKIQSLPLTSNQHRTPTAKQLRLKKISSTGSLISLHSSASISSIDSYIRVNNTRNLKESAAESSHNEVNKMIHLGEALGLEVSKRHVKMSEVQELPLAIPASSDIT